MVTQESHSFTLCLRGTSKHQIDSNNLRGVYVIQFYLIKYINYEVI